MTTIRDLLDHAADRRAAAERRRASATGNARSIIDRASTAGRGWLTAAEDQRIDTLLGERDSAGRELQAIDREVAELRSALADDDRATAAASVSRATGVARPNENRQTATLSVGRNERTYRPDEDPHGRQFLRDVARNWLFADPDASARLARHIAEERAERPGMQERAAGDSTTANWAGLTVPQYLTDMYAPAIAAMRPFADICNHHDLPPSGMTINISTVTTPTQVALQASELGAVAAASIDDTLLTENVQTASGQATLSRQAIDRGTGIEEATMQDLLKRYATTLDSTLITQATTGLDALAGANTTAYTTTAPTAAGLYPKLFAAQSALETALLAQAPPTHFVMAQRRWNWLTSQVGTSWPFLGGHGVGVQQGGAVLSNVYGTGQPRGMLSNGMLIITDANVPVNQGASTNQDPIYCVARDECHLWEDPNSPVYIRAEQPKAANLGVLLVLYGYFAYTFRRYASQPTSVTGTGLVTPSF